MRRPSWTRRTSPSQPTSRTASGMPRRRSPRRFAWRPKRPGWWAGRSRTPRAIPGGRSMTSRMPSSRVAAAVEAARSLPFPFIVVGRAENFLHGRPDLEDTIRRLQAFEAAGADALYAPGLTEAVDITAVCAAVTRPVNVLMGSEGASLFGRGTRRAGSPAHQCRLRPQSRRVGSIPGRGAGDARARDLPLRGARPAIRRGQRSHGEEIAGIRARPAAGPRRGLPAGSHESRAGTQPSSVRRAAGCSAKAVRWPAPSAVPASRGLGMHRVWRCRLLGLGDLGEVRHRGGRRLRPAGHGDLVGLGLARHRAILHQRGSRRYTSDAPGRPPGSPVQSVVTR